MKRQFIEKSFYQRSLTMIDQANAIIREYQAQGFTLTLRQLYYQFVARDLLPNKQRSYDNLGNLISDARLAGLIDWDAIEDRTRFLRGHRTYNSPSQAVDELAQQYRIDMWRDQSIRVEVWIEKDALLGVIERICSEYDVNYFACRGYASQSELYAAGQRMKRRWLHEQQTTLVLHLGDHDPSGIDMTRDNEDRLLMFSGHASIEVHRIALNMDQVEQYDPPPNPTKLTDSRSNEYIERFGEECWELDALSPKVIEDVLREHIVGAIDERIWNEREGVFQKHLIALRKASAYVKERE